MADPGARSMLAEALHSAFQKGFGGRHVRTIEKAIAKMPNDEWSSALDRILLALGMYGWEVQRQHVLQPPKHTNPALPMLLRTIASSQGAKESGHDIIFNAAADELDHWRKQTGG